MSYSYYRKLKRPFLIGFSILFIAVIIKEKFIDHYHEKKYEKRMELFRGDILIIKTENARLLIDYKFSFDSLYLLNDKESIKKLNSTYKSLFDKLRLSERVSYNEKYLLIEFETKVDTKLAIMITKLSPNEIFENLHEFIHYRTLFAKDERANIYIVKNILDLK